MIAAVALLARMTPAIDQILEDNEKSIRAVERMLLALAETESSLSDDAARIDEFDLRRRHFERALAEAEGNITEPSEAPVLARIAERQDSALAGDPRAIAAVQEDLWTLGNINRERMLAANSSAKRLGTAGAWALVLLGLIGLAFSIALMRRARGKLINPVYELSAVLEACSAGEVHRRFNPASASREFQEVAEVVNQLVSEHFTRQDRGWEPVAKLDRLALLQLLDRQAEAWLVCAADGTVTAANEAGLDALGGVDGRGLRDTVVRACAGERVESVDMTRLDDAGFLCRVLAQSSDSALVSALVSDSAPVSDSVSAPVSDSVSETVGSA
jgi:hypothetical protein